MSIIENAKEAVKLVQQIDNIELYRTILNLQAEIMEVVDQNRTLKSENEELKEQLKFKEGLIFEGKAYWFKNSEGIKEGPFCSNCWDVKKLSVRLHVDGTYHFCPNCKVEFRYPPDSSVGAVTYYNPFKR